MTILKNKYVTFALLATVIILIYAAIKGCNNSRDNAALAVNYKQRENDLKDSIRKVNEEKAAYKDTVEFLVGQLSLNDNKLLSLNEDLRGANDRITVLLRKHIPIPPSLDTNVTTVPNVFIDECAECFKELGSGQKLVAQYKADKDAQSLTYGSLLKLKDNRINSLEKSNSSLTKSYASLLDSSKRFQDKFIPRGRLYLSWGVLWRDLVPWAAGAGVMYQTRRSVIIGGSWYYNSQGHMVQTNIHFPLSFKKR